MSRWHSCNVLHFDASARRVWQFDARNGSFGLHREQVARPGEPLPSKLVGKGWNAVWQKKLNVAWLPPENVFIRVAQFPQSSPEETRSMVELQLEKLSPIPVTQAVWTMQVLPPPIGGGAVETSDKKENLQTVIVTVVARSVVEEFLGQLEGQGYQADRLELPLLDQLQGANITDDGAWIYPEAQGGKNSALVAWWYGGRLQNVDLLTLPEGADAPAGLRDQLTQMAWAGELEGWLKSAPQWHVVADEATAAEWMPRLREGLGQPVEVVPPISAEALAARTARRATQADPRNNLLPAEFVARYQRQFEDRLWARALGWALTAYMAGLVIYFIALGFLSYKANAAVAQVQAQANTYTNAIQTKAQYVILKTRNELQFAALDCWEAVAESLPENVSLESMNFSDGRKIMLTGTAGAGQWDPLESTCRHASLSIL